MRLPLLAALLALLAAAAPPARAFQKDVGGNTADFLRIGAGARALGMGEAYGAVAEGAEAIYWNPAGLAQMRRPELSYTRSEFLQFFHHDFLAYAHPVGLLRGTLAASITRLSQNSMPLVNNANIQVGQFAPHSEAFALAYAHSFEIEEDDRNFRDYFRDSWFVPGATRPLRHESEPWTGTVMIGASVKVISETINDRSAGAFAMDGGAIFRPVKARQLSLSAVLRNLGSREKFISESEALPAEVAFGAAWDQRWWKSRLLPSFELTIPYYGNPHAKVGVEYRKNVSDAASVAIRAGYKSQPAADLAALSGITFGVGGHIKRLGVDFGFEPMAELGQVYRLGVSVDW